MSDHSDIVAIQKVMMDRCRDLHAMADSVGKARSIREFSGDRIKRALAVEMKKNLDSGMSVAAAESHARASLSYSAQAEDIAAEHATAEAVIARWQATQCSYEAARSLLSLNKQMLNNL